MIKFPGEQYSESKSNENSINKESYDNEEEEENLTIENNESFVSNDFSNSNIETAYEKYHRRMNQSTSFIEEDLEDLVSILPKNEFNLKLTKKPDTGFFSNCFKTYFLESTVIKIFRKT